MRNSLKGLAFLAAILPAYKIFTFSTGLGAVIASVPVMKTVEALVDLPPVASKILGFLVVGGLLIVSWYVAEAVIVLGAIAITGEIIDLIGKIQEEHQRKRRPEIQQLRSRFNVGAPQLHIVEERL